MFLLPGSLLPNACCYWSWDRTKPGTQNSSYLSPREEQEAMNQTQQQMEDLSPSTLISDGSKLVSSLTTGPIIHPKALSRLKDVPTNMIHEECSAKSLTQEVCSNL